MTSGTRDSRLPDRGGRRRASAESDPATLAALLVTAAERDPDRSAVVCDGVEITYRDLDTRSSRLARLLLAAGAGPETAVAVALPRSLDSVLAVWAIAKTGAAFVPVDPALPPSRIRFQVVDSGATLGLTRSAHTATLPAEVTWLALDDARVIARVAANPPSPIGNFERPTRPRAAHTAYVIYTSGSTGRPKGVAVTHAGLAALCAELAARPPLDEHARVLNFASPSFDASVLELLLAISRAATLVIAPPTVYGGSALAELLARESITHVFLTPSVLASIEPAGLPALRSVMVGGEPCPPMLPRHWATEGRVFHNVYGPTETTVMATLSPALAPDAPLTIGSAVRGMRCQVLDHRLRPVGAGVVGELYVSGPGVARGYHGRPGLTAQRFAPDPFGPPGCRMYRTGDLVRRNATGHLEFFGRADDQVKVRGFRIELGEIDAILATRPGVRLAVTVDRKTVAGETTLAAFIQPEPGHVPDPAALAEALSAVLPKYMVPDTITVLERIPRTPTGKADRPALRVRALDEPDQRAPADLGEELIAEVFARVLGRERFGADSDFFAAGGNSLLATQVAARLSEIWRVRVPPRLVFDHPTALTLATAIRSQPFGTVRPRLRARTRPARIPLSPAQLRFWLRNRFDPASWVDNIGFALRLPDLDVAAARAALADTVERHESLRTIYPADDAGPRQRILEPGRATADFAVEELPEDDAVPHRVRSILRQGFDVAAEVPLRVRLLRTPTQYVLVCALHHICADGSSLAPLARDVALAYAARAAGAPPTWRPPEVQYADYTLWQRDLLGSRDDPDSPLSRQLSFWTRELAGLPGELDLPADRPRPAVATLRGSATQRSIPATLHRDLLAVAGTHRATLFMVMRCALAVLLARLSGSTDIAIGVPTTTRTEPALTNVVGVFVNTTVSRTVIDSAEGFTGLLRRCRERDLAGFAHADVPFEHVVDAIAPARSPGRHPLYQVGFAFHNFTQPTLELSGPSVSLLDVDTDTAKTDLHIDVADTRDADGEPDAIVIRFVYSTDLFDEHTVQRFLDGYIRVLRQVAADPGAAVGDLDIMDPVEHKRIRFWGTGSASEVPTEPLTAAFERQARATPDAIAVVHGPETITYAQLRERSARLARWLIEQGVGPETVVAVAMRRSIQQVVALYAIVAAGAAWVPIDPGHPAERIRHALASAAPRCVLTTGADDFTATDAYDVGALDLDRFDPAPVTGDECRTPWHADQPAYVDASWSTGRTESVVVAHRAIAHQLAWMQSEYGVDAADVYLHKTPATFDVSLWGYFLPLRAGARLVLAGPEEHHDPAALRRLIAEHRVTLADFVPALLPFFTKRTTADEMVSLRAVFVLGEALSPQTTRGFAGAFRAGLHNLYGPAEAAASVVRQAGPAADRTGSGIPIGVPGWNSRCQVLDERLRPVPVGVPGELYLGGINLARGYHGAPGATAARFVADPLHPGERMYRTGDLVRWNRGGALDYLCRSDIQVPDHRKERGGTETASLPRPMSGARPGTPLERAIAEVFADVLAVSPIGAGDDFFELGGSSLLAFTVHRRLSARLRRDVPMSAVLAAPTVGGLAARLSEAAAPTAATPARDAVLEPDIDIGGCAPAHTGPPQEVLLTGATGFLGAHLLQELLDRTEARVWCVVRADDAEEGIDRILAALNHYRLAGACAAQRIVVVAGDLTVPRLGLDPTDYDRLADSVDAIYHNGARVDHLDPYPRLRQANVEGTRELLRLATNRRVKPFHLVSTVGAAVPTTPDAPVITEDVRLRADQVPGNGYLASKWVAEELVRQVGERGVPIAIYRPGAICGCPSVGVNSTDDALWNMVRAAATLGMAPDLGDATVSLVPVNYVAGAIVEISVRPRSETVYHLVNRAPLAVGEILASLRAHGLPVATAPEDAVRAGLAREARRRDAMGDDSLLRAAPLSTDFAEFAGHVDWADAHSRAALAGTGVDCPAVDRTVVDTFVREFIDSGFLPRD